MTLKYDDFRDAFEAQLAKAEIAYEAERSRVESMLAECGRTKVTPAKDYWHKLDHLRRKVNLLRKITETKHDPIQSTSVG
jgi:hypothetical protein